MFRFKHTLVYRTPVTDRMFDLAARCDGALKANGIAKTFTSVGAWLRQNVGDQVRPGMSKHARKGANWHVAMAVEDVKDDQGVLHKEWRVTFSFRDEPHLQRFVQEALA